MQTQSNSFTPPVRPGGFGVKVLQFMGKLVFRDGLPNFRRSLWYLYPYRGRLTIAIICTLLIAALWGGSLGLVLPGASILLKEEGLHGWAYSSISGDVVGAHLANQESLRPINGKDIARVVNVASVDKTIGLFDRRPSPAKQAGLQASDWIVGIDNNTISSREVLRRIANAPAGSSLSLMVLRDHHTRPMTVTLITGELGIGSRMLRDTVNMVPEPKNQKENLPIFAGLLVFALVTTVLRGIFTFIQEYLVGTAIWLGIMDMRCENYNKVLHLPITFFNENLSDATSRFVQDTNELARGQNTLLGKTMVEPAKLVASVIMALCFSWQLTLLALIAGPPSLLMIKRLGKKMHKASRKALESWSMMLAVLNETLQGIRVVKAYTMEGSERRRFFRTNRQLVQQQNHKERLDAATSPVVECLGITAAMIAAAVAGYLVFYDKPFGMEELHMDNGVFLAWMGASFAMFDPVRKLAKVTMRFSESEAAGKRIFELQDTAEEPHVINAPTLARHERSVEFRDVTYRYPNASTDAVSGLSLKIKAGQSVAIVGPNGSGKTTLVSLLPRLLDITGGAILIDGTDIAKVSARSLRRQIGLVTQDTVLFHATIAENIAYGLRRPRREDVLAAARRAYVDDFVRDLPQGYDTMVGEHGTTLSGGQKQRISIARAILRDPAIMIFDEAMSQVDSDSERRIHMAMQEFVKGRTTLTIAHRFATVLSADVIVVMADGTMVDNGTHEELLKRCEIYHHLYRTQFLDSGGAAEQVSESVTKA